jgi:hypothetical protein
MDQMAFDLSRAINERYRAGTAVIVRSNDGKVLHGRKELEARGTCVSSAVIRGIKAVPLAANSSAPQVHPYPRVTLRPWV